MNFLDIVGYNVFANFLLGATIQDSSKRERSVALFLSFSTKF